MPRFPESFQSAPVLSAFVSARHLTYCGVREPSVDAGVELSEPYGSSSFSPWSNRHTVTTPANPGLLTAFQTVTHLTTHSTRTIKKKPSYFGLFRVTLQKIDQPCGNFTPRNFARTELLRSTGDESVAD